MLWLIAILLIAICIWWLMNPRMHEGFSSPDTIFTCTTFFDYEKEDKWAAFTKGINSLLDLHGKETLDRIGTWLVINEWSEKHSTDWAKKVKATYPFMTFVQKTEGQKGQVASLNLILEEVRPYTYWIQWEEAWYTRAACLDRAFRIMDTTDITQLQMTSAGDTPDGIDSRSDCSHEGYCIVPPPDNMDEVASWSAYTLYEQPNWLGSWPCYSLRPSINRVSFYDFGYFDTDPLLWPVKFEWEYGVRWVEHGGIKAALPDGPVIRDKDHKSTYS